MKTLFLFFFLLLSSLFILGADQRPEYVGAGKCKFCHQGKVRGRQFEIWQKSGHASAYETLKSEESGKISRKMDVANPLRDDKCLKCHITSEAFKEEGVSCESCHGPGSLYKSAGIMTISKYEKDPEGMHKKAMAAGLFEPKEALCRKCHNSQSPTYKSFNFKHDFPVIAHPDTVWKNRAKK